MRDDDTKVFQSSGGEWPATDRVPIDHALSRDPELSRGGLARLVERYWRPVYVYLRARCRKTNEDAKDLTQTFFFKFLDREWLQTAGSSHRFRRYVLACLRNFVRTEHRVEASERRGGGWFKLDAEAVAETAAVGDPEYLFDREWARGLLDLSLAHAALYFINRNKLVAYEILQAAESGTASYSELATRFSMTVGNARRLLHEARVTLRAILFENIRRTAEPQFTESEMDHLFGALMRTGLDHVGGAGPFFTPAAETGGARPPLISQG